jgi:hypothetical protein
LYPYGEMVIFQLLHGAVVAIGILVIAALLIFMMPFIYVILLAMLIALIAIFVRLGQRS